MSIGNAYSNEMIRSAAPYSDLAVHNSFPSQEQIDYERKCALAQGLLIEARLESGFLACPLRCYLETRTQTVSDGKWVTMKQAQTETGLRPALSEPAAAGSLAVLAATQARGPHLRAIA